MSAVLRASCIGPLLLATVGAASAERIPVAALWLDGPHEEAAAFARALVTGRSVQPIGDPQLARLLVDGGPRRGIDDRLQAARDRFARQQCGEAMALLAEAEALVLDELPVEAARASLGEIGRLGLVCGDLLRDDAAASHAVRLFQLAGGAVTSELAALVGRHPVPPSPGALPLRVESDPAGATVYVDLRPVGVTPLDLATDRRADALIDLEAPERRKVHRQATAGGVLAVALPREERPGPLVDRLRATRGDAPPAEVARLGRLVGAARVLVARRVPGRSGEVQARLLEVASGGWTRPVLTLGAGDSARLLRYAALEEEPAAAVTTPASTATATKGAAAPIPAWKKWYVWVAGGTLVALVVGLVVASRIGDDKVTITVHR